MKGHVARASAGLVLGALQPLGKSGIVERITGGYLGVELADRVGIEDIFQIPLVLQREMVAAGLADSGKFAIEIRYPEIFAAVFFGIGTAHRSVDVGQRAGIGVGQFQRVYPSCLVLLRSSCHRYR